MRFTPHVTVATVVEDNGRFLLVEEMADGRAVFNQPAGHLEADESLTQAALRETLEETGWDIELTAVTGIYLYTAPSNGVTYQRICFAGRVLGHRPAHPLDEGIIGPRWMTRAELAEQPERWRSELVLRCIDDYLDGARFDLSLIRDQVESPREDRA
ncbi:MAG: NUDIX hydrolase [Pseudomonas sp.]|uniref:NUDIX hydrolase n=1 Tax=Pseudomonas sp. TaxID=306 RepID=UPI00339A70A4